MVARAHGDGDRTGSLEISIEPGMTPSEMMDSVQFKEDTSPFQTFLNGLAAVVFMSKEAKRGVQTDLNLYKIVLQAEGLESTFRDKVRTFERITQEYENTIRLMRRDEDRLIKESKDARERVLQIEQYWGITDFILFKFSQWRNERAKRRTSPRP